MSEDTAKEDIATTSKNNESQMENSFNLVELFASSTPIPLKKRSINFVDCRSPKKIKLFSDSHSNTVADKENLENDAVLPKCLKDKSDQLINSSYDDTILSDEEDEVIEKTFYEKTLSELHVTNSMVDETVLLIEKYKQTVDEKNISLEKALKHERNNLLETTLSELISKKNELENTLKDCETTILSSDDEITILDCGSWKTIDETIVPSDLSKSFNEESKDITVKENCVTIKLENVDYSPLKSIITTGVNIDFGETCHLEYNYDTKEKNISNLQNENNSKLLNTFAEPDFQKSLTDETQLIESVNISQQSNSSQNKLDNNDQKNNSNENVTLKTKYSQQINTDLVENGQLKNTSDLKTIFIDLTTDVDNINKHSSIIVSDNECEIISIESETDCSQKINETICEIISGEDNQENEIIASKYTVNKTLTQDTKVNTEKLEIITIENETDILGCCPKVNETICEIISDEDNQDKEIIESKYTVNKSLTQDTKVNAENIALGKFNLTIMYGNLEYILKKLQAIQANTDLKKKNISHDILNKINILTARVERIYNESGTNENNEIENKYQDVKKILQHLQEIIRSIKNTDEIIKKRLPFISDDPKENEDNSDPMWNILKKLETDEQRYKAVRKRWCNLIIPNPHQNLTHRTRCSKTANDLSINSNKSESNLKSVTNIVGTLRSQILNRYNSRKQQLHTEELEQQNKLMLQHVDEQNSLIHICNSVAIYRNRFEGLYRKQMEENAYLKRQSAEALFNLENEKNILCSKLKSKMEETKVFLTFYNGLDGQTALKLSDARMNKIIENHQTILNYDQIYASSVNGSNNIEKRQQPEQEMYNRPGGSNSELRQMHINNQQMYHNFQTQHDFDSNYYYSQQNSGYHLHYNQYDYYSSERRFYNR